ncbi:MAG: helix-turn-helix transcriptional regulator [Planctomycetes bacterium]|nr:helix-turn-helix transcriptional regulator [Planctomycetota bacterium]
MKVEIQNCDSLPCEARRACNEAVTTKLHHLEQENVMKFESQLLKGVAPAVVLEILSRGQMYGYELSQAIEQRSGDILTLGKGTLYPLLYNLEAKKLIKGKWEEADSGRKRRYYSITSKGKSQLAKQKEQLKELAVGLNFVFGGAITELAF